ncbi:Siderophore synthetase component [Aliiroseovarius halocynthiae]|uniref:Siderophore biosynthesis protein n=1 Tax=Aliiroseovarius halocynthiae TaxID=985055 RepID=A0A545SW59_9RHOB|nr:IucA/IucC family protein [Aliiroseovarius halocynthiae]TQV69195.1 siderophore biosynthesis protein [Aliiroseovarius halocynthiae]SMR71961.1 Siderophore synthetase component [Aliiroseovarius halocynthiae]
MPKHQNARWTKKLFEQYLNTFFRETHVDILQHFIASDAIPAAIVSGSNDPYSWFAYRFPATGITLFAQIEDLSLTGYHQYGEALFLQHPNTRQPEQLTDIDVLLVLIADELAAVASSHEDPQKAATDLLAKMRNSVAKSGFFAQERQMQPDRPSASGDFVAAEQGMVLGHPFHVTSKASNGFSQEDLEHYSPELGTSFQLHYFAIIPDLIETASSGVDVEQLIDPIATQQAKELLSDQFAQNFQLLPCHPWQANYLLSKAAVQTELAKGNLVHLGAIGEVVWPTSSVRTVWMPGCQQFLKLSLDVQITNFIRNNPKDQRQRAIDVSKVINRLDLGELNSSIELLCEHVAQSVKLPELDASFGILYRAGLSPEDQNNTRILGSLVEECLDTGELPLLDFVKEAARQANQPIDENFMVRWWYRYASAALVPTLNLFADFGISLEAHLQNSLMQFHDGFAAKLIVRDMEGASMVQCDALSQFSSDITPDSPAWYSADDCWFRFQYYVVVNHISHVIAAVARHSPATERALWRATRNAIADAPLSSAGRAYAEKLFATPTLPVKANMLSTFDQRGEKPSWIATANPLAIDRSTSLTPLVEGDEQEAWTRAEDRVLTQLIEALLFEGVVNFTQCDDRLSIQASDRVQYFCTVQDDLGFDRIRIKRRTLRRVANGELSVCFVAQFLTDIRRTLITDPQRWPIFERELAETLAKHSQSLANPTRLPLRDLDYIEQEARVSNGHLYHPCFKSRTGFTLDDNTKFGPEHSEGFAVIWIAVKADTVSANCSATTNIECLAHQHFSKTEQHTIKRQFRDLDRKAADYVIVPVHPWQWTHSVEMLYRPQIIAGDIIRLDVAGPTYLPQQSVRTLSNLDDIRLPSLKLSINMSNTSTSRVLAKHTVLNSAPISDWLAEMLRDDPIIPDTQKPVILKEFAGLSVNSAAAISAQYGSLGCIWRESVYAHLNADQSATPMTALTQIDTDAKPLITPWIETHGAKLWVAQLISCAYLPVLHMLWYHGVALEAHAQNMVLIHRDGLPVRVALKDFHDGVRYSRKWLRAPDAMPELQDSPPAHQAINPNSYLETDDADELRDFMFDALGFVNLAELGWFIQSHFDLEEARFWQIIADCIQTYQAEHPQLAERFELFNVFDDTLQVEQLASRRFLPEIRLRVMPVANPLITHLRHQNTKLKEGQDDQIAVS